MSLPCPLRINLLPCTSTLSPNIETHVVCVKPVISKVGPVSNVLPVCIQIGMPPNPPKGNFLLDMHVVECRYLNTLCIPGAKMAHRPKKLSITRQSWTVKVIPHNHTGGLKNMKAQQNGSNQTREGLSWKKKNTPVWYNVQSFLSNQILRK